MRLHSFIAGCLLSLPCLAAAHGNEHIVSQTIGTYLAEFSYDEDTIVAGEFFDFHSSLIDGGVDGWDFAPYTDIDFEIRSGDRVVYTKTFHTTALGFAGVTFAEPGEYALLIRYVDRSAVPENIIAEANFPMTVLPGRKPAVDAKWRDIILGGTALAVAGIYLAPILRRRLRR